MPRVGKRIRRIVHDRRGRDEPELQRGRVDGNGLDRRARGQIALRRAVQNQASLLLAHAAGHSHNVAGLIVNDNNAGLQLLRACGLGDVVKILINLLHCRLHIGVERGVNLIAARHEHLADNRLIVAGLFAEVPHHVVDDLIFKVGIVVLIAGGFAAGIMEHQLLRDGRVVLLLRDILLLEHLVENDDLPLLVLVGIDIRVVDRGVVRNADERGALGKVELAHALAEINLRRRLHALAVFAERDDVEIELHDLLFRVLLLKFQSAENFNKLPAHRDLVAARDIFDELLRDGRAAGLASSEEHFDAGLKRRHPVDALMVFKSLVLDGDAGMNEVLGNVLVLHPRAVRAAVELAQNDVLSGLRVFIIDDGGLIERKAVDRVDLRGEIVFDVQGKQARKNQRRQKQHQHHRAEYLSEAFQNPPCRRAGGLCIFICSHVVPPFYRKKAPAFSCKKQAQYTILFFIVTLYHTCQLVWKQNMNICGGYRKKLTLSPAKGMRLDCAHNFAPEAQNSTLARRRVCFRSAEPPDNMISILFRACGRETLRGFCMRLCKSGKSNAERRKIDDEKKTHMRAFDGAWIGDWRSNLFSDGEGRQDLLSRAAGGCAC